MAFVSRYQSRTYFRNIDSLYQEKLRNRDLPFIKMFTTPVLTYPSAEQISNLVVQKEIWAIGSSYSKLASQYYGDAELWWVIGWFNKKPTEFLMSVGDTVSIPLPLERILGYYGV
jgi:hypothetical protein